MHRTAEDLGQCGCQGESKDQLRDVHRGRCEGPERSRLERQETNPAGARQVEGLGLGRRATHASSVSWQPGKQVGFRFFINALAAELRRTETQTPNAEAMRGPEL